MGMQLVIGATLKFEYVQVVVKHKLIPTPNLSSRTVSFYTRVDQSEISATKKAFVSNPMLYKHNPVFG